MRPQESMTPQDLEKLSVKDMLVQTVTALAATGVIVDITAIKDKTGMSGIEATYAMRFHNVWRECRIRDRLH